MTSATDPRITSAGVRIGMRAGLPLFASGFVYGLAFGSLAAGMGLSLVEAVLMSALVFSGTAQIAVVQNWASVGGVVPAALIVLIANVRYVVMGASLRPWLAGLPIVRVSAVLAMLVDSAFALGQRSRADGNGDAGVIVGAAFLSHLGWVVATGLGFVSGQLLANPRAFGLDFVVIAFCVAAATVMARQIGSIRSAVVAVSVAVIIIVVDRVAPGPWTVVAAGVGAAILGAILYDPERDPV